MEVSSQEYKEIKENWNNNRGSSYGIVAECKFFKFEENGLVDGND